VRIDYRKFLAAEEAVAPVITPGTAWVGSRRVRVAGAAPGWYRLSVKGRVGTVLRAAEPEEIANALSIDRLPFVTGHVVRAAGGFRVCYADRAEAVLLPSTEEPENLAPVVASCWASGDLFLVEIRWEGEAEEVARRAVEDRRGLADVRHAPGTLRLAFVLAVTEAASREARIPFAPAELRPHLRDIIDRGHPAAQEALAALQRARVVQAARQARRAENAAVAAPGAPVRVRAPVAPVRPPPASAEDLEGRLEDALRGAGARLLGHRRGAAGAIEVRWTFDGERFVTLVEEDTLRVRDAGICLTDHYTGERGDTRLTLESLPAVVREAIEGEKLVITRHHWEDRRR